MPDHPLAPLGWTAEVAASLASLLDAEPMAAPGRISRVERIHAFVRIGVAEVVATVAGGEALPVVGDWVVVQPRGPDTAVTAVAPRATALARRDPDTGQRQVLAANVDAVIITAAAGRLNPARIERELLIAWESGATPLVAVTKADAVPDAEDRHRETEQRLAGIEVILTSARTGLGMAELAAVLRPNRTAVFLGPSGAGKSSLANALLGEDVLRVGEVRARDRRGRHTTTTRQLVVVPTGGVLIDTPGIRSVGLVGDDESLEAVFGDIVALAEACRFTDCRHDREPDCAVRDALDRGELDPDRLASYGQLSAELSDLARPDRTNRTR